MRLYRVDSSVQGERSVTREITDEFEQAWSQTTPTSVVCRRDLLATPLSPQVWAQALAALDTPAQERTPEQRSAAAVAAELAGEMIAADVIVIAAPLYNWGPSPHIICWVDMLWTDPRFAPRTYPLSGKHVVIVTARGGEASPDGPRARWDNSTPYLLQTFGANVFGADVTLIETGLTLAEHRPALESQRGKAAELRARSRAMARQTGTALALRSHF